MHRFVAFVVSCAPPTLMVVIVFSVAYLLVGMPLHFARGPTARDVLGTLAGIFAALVYITLILGFGPDGHAGWH
ncbi:hypothetical protein [Paraburkholderia aromaticivorans]|uniref:Uncharacterized protein n=1 Tax=Paraburkholderia aromaticivorans TaxID=2026199 RepID=A0A248VKF8_9BURK|nr:hypothetical protein [Paraburkholderia aromaticivorans]ASV99324.1 hypothetical protein CJU94_14915 [Paraburkholderia aromaticivorans]